MREFDLYIVPTPIGNLGDMTDRAKEVLAYVDVIACEDMRVTQKLLNHFGIKTKCVSYHKFNEKERVAYFKELIVEGKKVALVSDAGTPLICDPGSILLKELRECDVKITSLPGANAIATFLSQIPREGEDFSFVGFLPKSENQIAGLINQYSNTDMVFYESPNRLMKTLEVVKKNRAGAKVVVGRELSKLFEEIVILEIEEMIEYFSKNVLKGEIVALVFREEKNFDLKLIEDKVKKLENKGFKAKEISVILSELYDVNKNDIYKMVLKK